MTFNSINSAPTNGIFNSRDTPELQVAANRGRPGQRPPGIMLALTFSGVCWRALNGRVREPSGDVLAGKAALPAWIAFSEPSEGQQKLSRLRAG